MLNSSPPSDLEHALQPRFLDSLRERASLAILREIGVSARAADAADAAAAVLSPELQLEHTRSAAATYTVTSGRVFLDVRDSADAWIRSLLTPGVALSLAPDVSRRFVADASLASSVPVVVRAQLGSCSTTTTTLARFARPSDALETISYHGFRELICDLCRQFYALGWVTGTGGSISIRRGSRIYMTPSGVSKERIQADELYMLDLAGSVLDAPQQKPGQAKVPKLSDCSPLFLHAYRLRGAGAVLHSHGLSSNLITALCDGQSEFRITHQEMIKGLAGSGYHDELVVPIIENTARESELADALEDAILKYPTAHAVLVRRHGIYVWGDSWEAAKRHGECLHYLFETALEMRRLGVDFMRAPPRVETSRKRARIEQEDAAEGAPCCVTGEPVAPSRAEQHQYVLLDIEGTTTPITFVHDVLFPFARDRAEAFLRETWLEPRTQQTVAALREQHTRDAADGLDVPPLVDGLELSDDVLRALVGYVHYNIAADRKIGALKQLQGYLWDQGYESGELKSLVYDDVPVFLARMERHHVRVGIYSSGSRAAQKSLFKYSNQGDLRRFLSVYFDTKVGHKRETASYTEILASLGVDSGKDVLFVTDVIQEAEAAAAAGLDVALSVRPGNAPLPTDHGFQEIRSFAEL